MQKAPSSPHSSLHSPHCTVPAVAVSGSRVWDLGFRVRAHGRGKGAGVKCLGLGLRVFGFRV